MLAEEPHRSFQPQRFDAFQPQASKAACIDPGMPFRGLSPIPYCWCCPRRLERDPHSALLRPAAPALEVLESRGFLCELKQAAYPVCQ